LNQLAQSQTVDPVGTPAGSTTSTRFGRLACPSNVQSARLAGGVAPSGQIAARDGANA
jgi:hypothetical protein